MTNSTMIKILNQMSHDGTWSQSFRELVNKLIDQLLVIIINLFFQYLHNGQTSYLIPTKILKEHTWSFQMVRL